MAEAATDPINLKVFLSWLGGVEDEDLFQMEREIKELMALPGWEKLERLIDSACDRSLKQLKYANVKDHASMARDIGMVAGMEVQSAAPNAVLMAADRRREQIRERLRRDESAATAGGRAR